MPSFILAWVKVAHEGNQVELGDICSSQHPDMQSAEEAAREICGGNEHVLLKIYDPELIGERDPLELAAEYFKLCLIKMTAAVELLRKPIHKRKKKKLVSSGDEDHPKATP